MAIKPHNKIEEALPLNLAKKYTQIWKDAKMENHLDEWFKGKNRIYFPLYRNSNMDKYYQILDENGYDIISFEDGVCRKRGEQRMEKIGKVLRNKLKREDLLTDYEKVKYEAKELKNNLGNQNQNSDLWVVISRHAVDVAGMSTDRDWSSCIHQTDGSNKHYVERDIKNGTFVAYIITASDKNIKKPLARKLIKPYFNEEDEQELIYYPTKNYCININGFDEAILGWLQNKQIYKNVNYKLLSCLYEDGQANVDKRDFKGKYKFVDKGSHYETSGEISISNNPDIKKISDLFN